jgi:hypothetical protein
MKTTMNRPPCGIVAKVRYSAGGITDGAVVGLSARAAAGSAVVRMGSFAAGAIR